MSLSVGVIGLGSRMSGVLHTLAGLDLDVRVQCVADPDQNGAWERLQGTGMPCNETVFYKDADKMLEKERPDGILIGTRCNLHAQMAVKVIEKGIPLFLEKPVFMNREGEQLLSEAAKHLKAPVIVSFPLRVCKLALCAKDIMDRGVLGPIAHVIGTTTVPYARGYYKKWYRDGSITGGQFLQKATHDLDLIFFLTGAKPVKLCAMKTRAVMGGNEPAGILCDDCAKRYTCPESDWTLEHKFGETRKLPHVCSFGEDVTIEDAGSTLILLDNGAHVTYAQCFAARKDASRRMTRIIGLYATLELDFSTSTVKVFHHTMDRVDTYQITDNGTHSGGDEALMEQFVHLMRGENIEHPTLEDGLLSARTCLRATESADEMKYIDL